MTTGNPPRELRRGWTTGACATAATKAAFGALAGLDFASPVTIRLPRGGTARFGLAEHGRDDAGAWAGVIKDAGDDPDVTHGCLVRVRVRPGVPGSGVTFHAGPGVGTVTRPGLQLEPGEAAINPVPRQMMREVVAEIAAATGASLDVALTISIPGGEILAEKTMNGRLGIVGGLSILGTTGMVIPYSCAAWIHSIHRGIDVARAAGLSHIAAATGSTSERTVQALYGLPEMALLDMGDFAGGTLKYLRRHPVPRLSLAGGFAKLAKLAQGQLDLHSSRSRLDQAELARFAAAHGAAPRLVGEILAANTAGQILANARAARFPLADLVAAQAQSVSREVAGAEVAVEVLVVDRQGDVAGRAAAW
jgi:cobalt-precorrin-5B (C1)-methyltransferase